MEAGNAHVVFSENDLWPVGAHWIFLKSPTLGVDKSFSQSKGKLLTFTNEGFVVSTRFLIALSCLHRNHFVMMKRATRSTRCKQSHRSGIEPEFCFSFFVVDPPETLT
jgi:hypothetical protein